MSFYYSSSGKGKVGTMRVSQYGSSGRGRGGRRYDVNNVRHQLMKKSDYSEYMNCLGNERNKRRSRDRDRNVKLSAYDDDNDNDNDNDDDD